jgi:hypothetical protein
MLLAYLGDGMRALRRMVMSRLSRKFPQAPFRRAFFLHRHVRPGYFGQRFTNTQVDVTVVPKKKPSTTLGAMSIERPSACHAV